MRYPFNGHYPVTSPYGVQRPGHTHRGVDFGTPVGTPMIACADGRVIYAGNEIGGAGNHLVILFDYPLAPNVTRYGYMHLSRFDVGVNQQVRTGQQVGLSGGARGEPGAGDSTGPHLHFWTGLNAGFGAVDPMPYLGHDDDTGEDFLSQAEMDTLGQWEQDTRKVILDQLAIWMQEQSANVVKLVNAHIDQKFAELEAKP